VVSAPLQDLGEETLDPAAMTREGRVEEDQPQLFSQRGDGHCHNAPPVLLKGEDLALARNESIRARKLTIRNLRPQGAV
jgi:hypothetical protein